MKTRFCPSPTGHMHLGNARTALFSALLAKKQRGTFLIRIEDTDEERSEAEHTQQILEDLKWLDLHWQEGPEVGGSHGPYWQSERNAIYHQYYKVLEERGLAYPCFCTPEQLALSRKLQLSQGKPPRYAGTCRHLSHEIIRDKLAQGLKPTLRFLVQPKQVIQFHDLIKGRQRFNSDEIGDFIIRRADGSSAFFFCNALDDSLMEVTHVIRGEDHLSNTPRQILILQALELPIPEYGHMPLILGPDGAPLSKRNGSRSIKELREAGYLPLGINNYLARLGHRYEKDMFGNLQALADGFSFECVSRSAARFDANHLDYWQREAINHCDEAMLWHWFGEDLKKFIPDDKKQLFLETVRTNIEFPEEATVWAMRFFSDEITFDQDQVKIIKEAGNAFFEKAIEAVELFQNNYEKVCQFLKEQLGVKGKQLFMPLRIAITYTEHGPELTKIFQLMGQEKILLRLQNALTICQE
jgi:glutamyl-tRNA synthetase